MSEERCTRCNSPFAFVDLEMRPSDGHWDLDWDGECAYCFMYPNELDDTDAQVMGIEFIPLSEVRIEGYFY